MKKNRSINRRAQAFLEYGVNSEKFMTQIKDAAVIAEAFTGVSIGLDIRSTVLHMPIMLLMHIK